MRQAAAAFPTHPKLLATCRASHEGTSDSLTLPLVLIVTMQPSESI